MKVARREFLFDGERVVACYVYCPACEDAHRFIVEAEPGTEIGMWDFDGNMELPSFEPSLLVTTGFPSGTKICHSYLRSGVWEFLPDCTHGFAGNKTRIIDFPENYMV